MADLSQFKKEELQQVYEGLKGLTNNYGVSGALGQSGYENAANITKGAVKGYYGNDPRGLQGYYNFLLPGIQTGGSSTSVMGTGGAKSNTVAIQGDPDRYVSFADLESFLGTGSGATTPNLYQNPGSQAEINAIGAAYDPNSRTAFPGTYGSPTYNQGENITMTAPTILSSQNARQQAIKDQGVIQNGMASITPSVGGSGGGQGYTVQSGDTLSKIAQQMGTTVDQLTGYRSGDPSKIFPGEVISIKGGQGGQTVAQPITISTANAAMKSIIDNFNTLITQSGTQLTPEQKAAVDRLNELETAKNQALAAGQSAMTSNNPSAVNEAATAVKGYEAQIQKELTDFQAKVEPLRKKYLESLLPSAQVQDVQTRLKNLQSTAKQSLLDTKGQPISTPFIAGQTAQQKEQFALEESNLLTELGLAQDAQDALQKAAAGELDFAMQDYELQSKVTEKLMEREESLVQRAREASSDVQSFYANVAKTFAEVKLSPESKAELQRMAIDVGADPALAADIASSAYQQTVFDNAIKTSQEKRLGGTGATTYTPPPQPTGTLDQFIKEKYPNYWVLSPQRQAEIKKEFEAPKIEAAQAQSILSAVKNLRFGTVEESKRIIDNVTKALNSGGVAGAEDELRSFGYQKLNGSQKIDYDLYDTAISASQSAANQIENAAITAGPYKSLLETAKPWLSIQRDKQFVDLKSTIELGQAQIRKGFYGTAVTDGEAANARNFLVQDSDDINTIKWKLENSGNFLRFVNDAQIARSVNLPKPNINDYLIPAGNSPASINAAYLKSNGL